MGEVDARQRFDEAMQLRQRKIRKKWNQIAEKSGMRYQSLHRLRTNPDIGITPMVADNIEDAMMWPRGTIDAVTSGKITPEEAAALPRLDVVWTTGLDVTMPRPAQPHVRAPIDPLTSSLEEISAYLADVEEVEGKKVAAELQASIIRVRALAAKGDTQPVTSADHEE